MATVTRIAAVPYLDTIPFLYGVAHADELRAELFLSDFPAVIDRFRRGEADFALVPAHVVQIGRASCRERVWQLV